MQKLSRTIILGWIVALLGQPALGIINIEAMRKEGTDPLMGQLSLQGEIKKGNNDQWSVKLENQTQWRQASLIHLLIVNGEQAESNKVTSAHSSLGHYRLIHLLNDNWAWENYLQAEEDEFRRLNSRYLIGTGIRWNSDSFDGGSTLAAGLGAFYSEERYAAGEVASPEQEIVTRLSSYLSAVHPLSKTSLINFTAYFQPTVIDMDDYRILAQFDLVYQLTARLENMFTIDYYYDSLPPAEIKDYDLTSTLGLRWKY